MLPKKNKRSRFAFKCILSLICLILFSVQLSYKFYQFSSFPSSHNLVSYNVRTGDKQIRNSPDKTSLSLDKRYDARHLFALISPFFDMAHPFVQNKCEFQVFRPAIIFSIRRIISLRGPPMG
jgi:hypothetical protein